MIEAILPSPVAVAEAREDAPEVDLFPQERAAVRRAVEKRRLEFATGRGCARRAMRDLGVPPSPVPSGSRGEPRWPPGVVGSITHCDGYRACAVARSTDFATLAIDAEPHAALPVGLLGDVAGPAEAASLAELSRARPGVHWDRLLFSAKESVFKAWYPLTERRLEFEDATVAFDPAAATFTARLLVPGPVLGRRRLDGFEGRWAVADGLLLTAIAVRSRR